MKKLLLIPCLLVPALATCVNTPTQEKTPLRLVQTIALPAVEGRIDHLAADLQSQRLFLAALGNNTLEVIDLTAGRVIHSVKGLHEPQGVAFVPEAGAVYVANGGNGRCEAFAADSLAPLRGAKFSGDADNLRYDAATKLLYVGYGDGAIGIFEALTGKIVGEIRLPAHPEAFSLEQSGSRIFVNIPKAKQVAVIDRNQRAVVAQWPVTQAAANYPMALDEAHHRLFIGCRQPARLLVLDTDSGKVVAQVECAGDTDDVFYDAKNGRVYMSGGEGFISVFARLDADKYQPMARIPTAAGARTSLFVPALGRLYLAVPRRGGQSAEVRVYETQ
ncbi:MAG TPA: YncE family protein [Blastocatellia bacterium]|nr:YncE family protein [Blastocatellia bacterium]